MKVKPLLKIDRTQPRIQRLRAAIDKSHQPILRQSRGIFPTYQPDLNPLRYRMAEPRYTCNHVQQEMSYQHRLAGPRVAQDEPVALLLDQSLNRPVNLCWRL